MYKPNHSQSHLIHNNWQVDAAQCSLDELILGMTSSGANHKYLAAHALDGVMVQVLADRANVGPTHCDHSVAAIIYDSAKEPVNVLAMVIDSQGNFEDVVIPGARLAGCFVRIGEKSDCSGLMYPDTNLGENARHGEVFDEQAKTYIFP
ncbi:hypothetical protein J2X54_003289, partial [Duganella sp. 3397]|uniref:hypothetical protein n=1 Tax=Duganella sp. 3397 TaxID=2817732 RepID=UPI00285D6342